jgi:hypothetical protein
MTASFAASTALVIASACGSSDVTPGSAGAVVDVPDVDVRDVQSGDTVALRDVVPAALPTMVWFWAPH